MEPLICSRCSSTDMELVDGFYVCKICGTRYFPSLDSQKKQQANEKSEKAIKEAEEAVEDKDYKKASRLYKKAISFDGRIPVDAYFLSSFYDLNAVRKEIDIDPEWTDNRVYNIIFYGFSEQINDERQKDDYTEGELDEALKAAFFMTIGALQNDLKELSDEDLILDYCESLFDVSCTLESDDEGKWGLIACDGWKGVVNNLVERADILCKDSDTKDEVYVDKDSVFQKSIAKIRHYDKSYQPPNLGSNERLKKKENNETVFQVLKGYKKQINDLEKKRGKKTYGVIIAILSVFLLPQFIFVKCSYDVSQQRTLDFYGRVEDNALEKAIFIMVLLVLIGIIIGIVVACLASVKNKRDAEAKIDEIEDNANALLKKNGLKGTWGSVYESYCPYCREFYLMTFQGEETENDYYDGTTTITEQKRIVIDGKVGYIEDTKEVPTINKKTTRYKTFLCKKCHQKRSDFVDEKWS